MSTLNLTSGRSRLQMILQTEAAECGLACLAMMLCHFGHQTDMSTLRSQLSVSLKGMSLAQLISAAQTMGLAGRPLRVDLDELKDLKTPCILHWDLNHLVVLKSIRGKRVVIHDPAVGIRTLGMDEVSDHFTGIALELSPTSVFEAKTDKHRLRVRSLFGKVVGLKRILTQIGVLSLGVELLLLLSPMYVQWVVDQAVVSSDKDLVHLLALAFAAIAVIQVLITTLRSWVVLNFGTSLGVQWSVNVFSHMVRLPMNFFEKRHLGDVTSRFDSLGTIQSTLSRAFIEASVDALMVLITLVMMLMYSGLLSAVALTAAIIYGLLRWAAFSPLRQATQEMIVLGAKQETTFLETVRAIQAIKLFGRESQRQGMWHNRLVDTTNRLLKTERFMIGYQLAHGFLGGLENILIVWLGAQLILESQFTIGMLFAFVSYSAVFSTRTAALIDNGMQLKMMNLHAERLADIVLTPQEFSLNSKSKIVDGAHDITIKNLSFRYSDLDPFVIKNLNLTIKQGMSVALIGPSGCGKTTLAKLLLGLLSPTEGSIKIGDQDLSKVDIQNYRKQVNAVMQDDQLLAGSIGENICFFDEHPDQERIEHAARLAAIDADIKKMAMSYQTLVGDLGTSLSGGQKQRVLLARALYRNPNILVLDEATSHLDVALEHAVNNAVRQLPMTRIVIAHRPETIASCDVVIDLSAINSVDTMEYPSKNLTMSPLGAHA